MDLTKILRACFYCIMPEGTWGAPVLLWAPAGVGKTATARAAARASGLNYYRVSASERGEGQFGVVPVPGADGLLHYPPPDWAGQLDVAPSLLFVDEIDSVPPALQPVMLGLVQLRVLGSHQFAPTTRVIAAANGVAGTWDIRTDVLNRFVHLQFDGYHGADWAAALIGGFAREATPEGTSAADEQQRVANAWPGAIARARGLVAAFISRNTTILDRRPAKGSTDKAYPTPRTWEYATALMASAEIQGLSEIDTDALLAGVVGRGAVSEYRRWAVHADLPDPADVLDGRVKFVHDPRHLDRTLVVLASCSSLVIPEGQTDAEKKRRIARGEVLWGILDVVVEDAADIVMAFSRALLKARVIATGPNVTSKWVRIGGRLKAVMDLAGVQ